MRQKLITKLRGGVWPRYHKAANHGHYPGLGFVVTAPSPSRLAPLCRRSQGRDTARAASRPVSQARRRLPAAQGRRETRPRPRAGPGAEAGGRHRLFLARSHHVGGTANTAEMGAGSRASLSVPGLAPARPGPGSPTCVSDDDVLEEVRVGHGRSRAAAPGLSRSRSGVTRALAARARAAERRKRVNGPRAAPPPARSLLPPPPRRRWRRGSARPVRLSALPRSLPPRPRRRRESQNAAAAARTINRRRAAPGPSGDVSARPLTPPRLRPGNAEARGRLPPRAGRSLGPRPAGVRAVAAAAGALGRCCPSAQKPSGWERTLGSSSPNRDQTPACQLDRGTESFFTRDGDSITFFGSPSQCLSTLSVKRFFLISNLNLPWYSLTLYPVILSMVAWERQRTLSWL